MSVVAANHLKDSSLGSQGGGSWMATSQVAE